MQRVASAEAAGIDAVLARRDADALRVERTGLRAGIVGMMEGIVDAAEKKHALFHGHSVRVAELARLIATQMRLSPDTIEEVRLAGRMHDIGNIGVRDDVLMKPATLTPEELAHLQEHVRTGAEALRHLGFIEHVVRFVADHHEHWDGSGYPEGRVGSAISMGGRIVAAAEILDALMSRRSYRDAMSRDAAIEVLRHLSGSVLDPHVYEAARAVMRAR